MLAEQGDTSRALDLLQQARVIIAKLAQQSPDNSQLSKDLAVFDDNIARLKQASTHGLEAEQPRQAANKFSGKIGSWHRADFTTLPRDVSF